MNNRRKLVIGFGIVASMPRIVIAQAKNPPVVIGWLSTGSAKWGAPYIAAFRELPHWVGGRARNS